MVISKAHPDVMRFRAFCVKVHSLKEAMGELGEWPLWKSSGPSSPFCNGYYPGALPSTALKWNRIKNWINPFKWVSC